MSKTATSKSTKSGIAINTLVRAFSALVALPIIIYGLMTGGVIFTVLICLIFGIALLEIVNILRHSHLDYVAWLTLAVALLCTLTFAYSTPMIWAAVTVVGAVCLVGIDAVTGRNPRDAAVMVALALLIAHIAGFSIVIRNDTGGVLWWLLILIATWATDTLAFAGGRTYGRTPLSLRWSPKKTIEGTITGVVGAIIIGIGSLAYYRLLFWQPMVIVAIAPFAAVVGDLLESRFKREYEVKDSSIKGFNVVPGHGGMLDRIDSLSAVIVTVYVLLWAFQLL